jgi:hypothetical protein
MQMKRTWAVYDVFLGTPVLVERCATKAGAVRVAQLRMGRGGVALHIVEQLLPDRLGPTEIAKAPPVSQPNNGDSA